MKEYLTVEYAPGYGIELQQARRFTEEEKKKYAEWYRELGFIPTGDRIKLEHVKFASLSEVLKGEGADGSFPGSDNYVWIITREQWNRFIELNAVEKEEAEKREREEQICFYREVVTECEKQGILYTSEEAKAKAKAYNDINNEGGEGYVPHFYTKDEYDYAKERLAELYK